MKKSLKAPCSCSGNVKQYEPGYTAPPPKKSKINVEAMSIRYLTALIFNLFYFIFLNRGYPPRVAETNFLSIVGSK
ncbi:hypothetical protein MtrunA17_Chr3g0099671 [Medicago truncatula]|uniref:Transmembrane protein n=1 Tax=Medicago truncatula TaxID=3880 RepID=A0A396IT80_MEDTR|nr:hypothetical protein MtrunA17_Chr3g0099671 [Medicago truncatula]